MNETHAMHAGESRHRAADAAAKPTTSPFPGIDLGAIIGELSSDDQFWLDLSASHAAGPSHPPHPDAASAAAMGTGSVGSGFLGQGASRAHADGPASMHTAGAALGGVARPPPHATMPQPMLAHALPAHAPVADATPPLFTLDLVDKVPFRWERCTARLHCSFAPEGPAPTDDGELGPLSVRVTTDKPLLYSEKRRQWTWHKKWTLPRLSVELLSGGRVLTGLTGLSIHVTAVLFNEEQERMDEVGLTGKQSVPYVGGVCSFSSLFFKSTSFNNKGASFHLLIGVTHRAEGPDGQKRLLACWHSSPIHVDARKRQLTESTPSTAASTDAPRPGGALAGAESTALGSLQQRLGPWAAGAAGAGVADGGREATGMLAAAGPVPSAGGGGGGGGSGGPVGGACGAARGGAAARAIALGGALSLGLAGPLGARALSAPQPTAAGETDLGHMRIVVDAIAETVALLAWRQPGAQAHEPSVPLDLRTAELHVIDVLTSSVHGFSAAEVKGKDYLQLVVESERALLKGVLMQLDRTGTHAAVRVQTQVTAPSGERLGVDASLRCDGAVEALMPGARDVLLLSARALPSWYAPSGFHAEFAGTA